MTPYASSAVSAVNEDDDVIEQLEQEMNQMRGEMLRTATASQANPATAFARMTNVRQVIAHQLSMEKERRAQLRLIADRYEGLHKRLLRDVGQMQQLLDMNANVMRHLRQQEQQLDEES